VHLFAIATTDERIEPSDIEALAGRATPGPSATWVANDQCVLGLCRGSDPYPLTLASAGPLHAAFAGDILEPLSDEPDFAASTPAAVLLERLRRHGPEALTRIDGLFSALIWDEAARRLTAISDRVGGFQAIYYARQGRRLALCSRLHVLLSLPWVSRTLDPAALHELFATGYVLPPHTLSSGVRKLAPGEALTFERGEVKLRLLDRASPGPMRNREQMSAEAFAERLARSLERTAARGGRRAYLLSGGIDSSTLVTLASRADTQPIAAFTGAFSGSAMDESAYARKVAEGLGCAHSVVDLGSSTMLDALPQVVWHLGEPAHDFSAIPTYHLFRRVREHADTVVSGDGPDHLFCRYNPLAAKRLLAPVASGLPPSRGRWAQLPGLSMIEKIRRAGARDLLCAYRELYRLPTWGPAGDRTLRALLPVAARSPLPQSDYLCERRFLHRHRLADLLADLTYVDLHVDGSFGVFQKVGAMARANGLVVREPFLDRDVADCILSLPREQWVRGSWWRMLRSRAAGKVLLKHELGPRILPSELIVKPKHGFTPPLAAWLGERLRAVPIEQWLCPALRTGDILDPATLERIVAEHCRGTRNWSIALFLVLSLDAWYRMTLMDLHTHEPHWTLRDTGFGR
jgi:asparagine synthase (glutamine-hydrolysing)